MIESREFTNLEQTAIEQSRADRVRRATAEVMALFELPPDPALTFGAIDLPVDSVSRPESEALAAVESAYGSDFEAFDPYSIEQLAQITANISLMRKVAVAQES